MIVSRTKTLRSSPLPARASEALLSANSCLRKYLTVWLLQLIAKAATPRRCSNSASG